MIGGLKGQDFLMFIIELISKLKTKYSLSKVVLFYDNARIHTMKVNEA